MPRWSEGTMVMTMVVPGWSCYYGVPRILCRDGHRVHVIPWPVPGWSYHGMTLPCGPSVPWSYGMSSPGMVHRSYYGVHPGILCRGGQRPCTWSYHHGSPGMVIVTTVYRDTLTEVPVRGYHGHDHGSPRMVIVTYGVQGYFCRGGTEGTWSYHDQSRDGHQWYWPCTGIWLCRDGQRVSLVIPW